ncbi:unnamed protein product, partial [Musa acuminata subsp. burmannicoides]
ASKHDRAEREGTPARDIGDRVHNQQHQGDTAVRGEPRDAPEAGNRDLDEPCDGGGGEGEDRQHGRDDQGAAVNLLQGRIDAAAEHGEGRGRGGARYASIGEQEELLQDSEGDECRGKAG